MKISPIRPTIFLILVIISLLTPEVSFSSQLYSLSDCIEIALKGNPELLASKGTTKQKLF